MLSLIACFYLLFRRSNAIAPDVKSPVRLRRWTAVFFGSVTLCHLWYLPSYFLSSNDDKMLGSLIAGLLDEFDIHPAKESEVKIVDWDRTYFPTIPQDIVGETKLRQVKTRVNQNVFRQIVLANYEGKCALTGIDLSELLVASYIIPWADNEQERLNPENGI